MTDTTGNGLLISLSAGGTAADLAGHGVGVEHVEEFMVRLAMRLLTDGHRLAFGGILERSDRTLTGYLIDVAQQWLDKDFAKAVNVTKPATWPLVNFSAWPNYTRIQEEQRAQLVGICQFVEIDPPDIASIDLKLAIEQGVTRRYAADALTAMRLRSTRETDLRIVWGGRRSGAAGWVPGILEEVACSLDQDKPVLIVGRFGGCAAMLAEFLEDPSRPWPNELKLSADQNGERILVEAQKEELTSRFAAIRQKLEDYRTAIHSSPTANGLPSELIRRALKEDTMRIAINIAAKAAAIVQKR